MNRKMLSIISYGTLILGAALGLYALAGIYFGQKDLPPGVCPITSNRPIIYLSIALCCISFIVSFFEPKAEKNKE